MHIEEALNWIKDAVFAKTGRHLSDAEETVLRGAWEGKTYDEIAQTSTYAVNYLKNDTGPNLWKFLSAEVFGGKVSKANLRAVLERYSSSKGKQDSALASPSLKTPQPLPQNAIDWGEAPNLTSFYGRNAELEELKSTIAGVRSRNEIASQKTQLLVLLGMRGIGKTALAVKLVETLKNQFDYVIWRSLDRNPPPPLADLAVDLLEFLSDSPKISLPSHPEDRIDLLLERLRKHRCLLVFDSADALMQERSLAGRYRIGYEAYGEFWRRATTERHQSCLLLTTRENPEELVELTAQEFPARVASIAGLPETDARQLLKAKGLCDEENYWNELIAIFQGNPLALQIVAARIQRSFGGRVSQFLKQKTITMRQIADLIDQQFQSLSTLEREIMYWLALQQQPMSFVELKEIMGISGAELLEALESLLRRSLIQGEAQFSLESVVRQYVLNEFARENLSLEQSQAKGNIKLLLERCFDKHG